MNQPQRLDDLNASGVFEGPGVSGPREVTERRSQTSSHDQRTGKAYMPLDTELIVDVII